MSPFSTAEERKFFLLFRTAFVEICVPGMSAWICSWEAHSGMLVLIFWFPHLIVMFFVFVSLLIRLSEMVCSFSIVFPRWSVSVISHPTFVQTGAVSLSILISIFERGPGWSLIFIFSSLRPGIERDSVSVPAIPFGIM